MNAKYIEELMRLRGWNQAELARQLDMSEATVSRWLNGERNPVGGTAKLLYRWLAEAREEARKQPA